MRRLLTVGLVLIAWALAGSAAAQTPRANGETVKVHHFLGSIGNMHGFVAARKGFCEKYNFHCELVSIPSALTAVQTVVGGSLDVAQGGIEMTAAAVNAGADVVIAGISTANAVLFISARADVPLPNRAKGYPAVMADFKGLKVGVPARGAAGEVYLNVMLKDGGLSPSDVTVVGVGGPQTAYTSMVVGKQVDAAVTFSPGKELCEANKSCVTVVDMTRGEGPALFRTPSASSVILVVRRQWADSNPALMAAFYAAMKDAAMWIHDPANFDALVDLYRPNLKIDVPDPDALLKSWVKNSVENYPLDLAVNRDGVKAALDFAIANKMLDKSVDVSRLVWDKAP